MLQPKRVGDLSGDTQHEFVTPAFRSCICRGPDRGISGFSLHLSNTRSSHLPWHLSLQPLGRSPLGQAEICPLWVLGLSNTSPHLLLPWTWFWAPSCPPPCCRWSMSLSWVRGQIWPIYRKGLSWVSPPFPGHPLLVTKTFSPRLVGVETPGEIYIQDVDFLNWNEVASGFRDQLQMCSYLHLPPVWGSGTSLDFSGFW